MLKTHIPIDTDAESFLTTPEALRFRDGMSRVAGAVHVVTTDGPAGRAGFTATAVTPVTDSPATLLVCINAAGRSAKLLAANGVFCVNTLAAEDQLVADAFAGRVPSSGDKFAVGDWRGMATGAPVLTSSLVAFECRLTDARLVATHYIIIGEVEALRVGESRPALVYCGRAYHAL